MSKEVLEQTTLDALAEEYRQNAIDTLGEAIATAISTADIDDVLALLTGTFVGLMLEVVRREGHDVNKEILLDGGPNRDITIHAPKA